MTGLTDARKKLPSLGSLDDAAFVDAVHTMYYPEMDKAELSARLGYQPPAAPEKSAGFVRSAGDVGIKLGQGVVDLGSAVIGVGSLASGGLVGKGMRAVGYDPKRTNEFLGEFLSDSQKASDEKVAQADGFVGTIAESVANPRAILGSIAQSAPGMVGGMGVTGALARKVAVRAALATGEGAAASAASLAAGRTAAEATAAAMATGAGRKAAAEAVNAAGTKLIGAGALTEGAQTAGNIADRAQTAGREYSDYALPAVGAGLGTAMIGHGAGKVMGDAATQIATRSAGAEVRGTLAGRIGKGVLSEGVLEEMPQSAQEQVFTNIAMGEADLAKGVGNAAGTGLITGMAMGGGMAALQRAQAAAPVPPPPPGPAPAPTPLPDTGPLSRAANAAQAALAQQQAAAATATPPAAEVQAQSLGQIDGRLAELIAIGRGSVAQRVIGADGQASTKPAVPGRRLTADEIAEYNSLKQARKARTEIPADQQAEFAALLAEEEAAINAKFEPAIAAAAEARALADEKQIAALLEEEARAQRAAAAEREAQEALTTNAIIEHERAERAAVNRAALRAKVLGNAAIPAEHKKRAFLAALKRDGYVNPALTAEDHVDIDDANTPVPSLPNELVDAVPERVEPVPASATTNTRAVDDAIAAGMRLKTANGAMLHKPGSSKIFKLSTAQKAYYQKVMARLEREAAATVETPSEWQEAAEITAAEETALQNEILPDVAPAVEPADDDWLYPQAEAFVRENATASVMALQQHLKVGYNRAQRLLEQMEQAGIVSPMASNGARSLIAPAPAAGSSPVAAETALDIAAHESATSPLNELAQPTAAQKEAGNYKLGRVKLHGLDLSIENPAGSTRSGVDSQGKAWETRMAHHYGYIRGTVGADKDHVDAFIGPNPDSDKVFVVDQIHPESGKFDEHKVMFGFDSLDDARDGYDANYAPGWKGGRHITETDTAAFKNWLASGQTPRPFAETALRRSVRAVEDMQAEATLLGATPEQVNGIATGEELWRKNFPKTYGNSPEERKAAPLLGKQELNRMTTRDMTDDQLLQAQKVFAGGPRAKKIEKAIAERGISPMAAPTPAPQMDPRAPAPSEVPAQEKVDVDTPAGTAPEHARMSADLPQSPSAPTAAAAQVEPAATKAPKKTKAAKGTAVLRADYGVEHIDGYAESAEFLVDREGDNLEGGIKGAFLKDAQHYLKDVASVFADLGYGPATRRDGKPMKLVSINESGEATSGEVSLSVFNDELDKGIYINIGGAAVQGMVATTASNVAVMARVTERGAPFSGGANMWMETSLTARELAERLANTVKSITPGNISDTLATTPSKKAKNGRSDTGREGAQALGAVASTEDGTAETAGRMERSDADGRDPGAPADRGAENEGLPAARSGRGSAEPVYPADAGSDAGGRLGSARAGRDGKRVSKPDAGTSAAVTSTPAQAPSAPNIPAINFRITDDVRLGQGGEVQKFNDNLSAIRTMRVIEAENRRATPQEQAMLARYVGWGGLANAFPAPESGEFKDAWKKRGPELADLLSQKEYALARRSTLDSHYTSKTVVDSMWTAARRLGFKGGMALESSMGTGNFLGLMPADVAKQTRFIGVEYDNLTARIATLLYPAETVLNSGFQSVPLTDGSFDLSIGNPPFGDQSLRFQFKPEINGHSIHNQFFLAALDAVKPGGLQVQVVSRYLLDKIDSSSRTMLAKKAKLLGAIRLPDTAFKENARTSVVTDIVFLQRLTAEEETNMEQVFEAAAKKPERNRDAEFTRQALAAQVPDWIRTTSVADPLGGDAMPINTYFANNPQMIMGVLERSGSMAFGKDITVRLDDPDSLADRLAGAIARLPQDVMVQTQSGIDAAIARHKDMTDALRIALAGHENGSIKLESGALVQVVERETPEGAYELSRRTLSPESPWSESLYMNSAGQWYVIEAQLGADGKPAKLIKDGKQTKLNIYDRNVFASEADIPTGMLLGQLRFDRLKQMVGLRDLLKEQLSMEAENVPAAAIEANRSALKAAYDAFVKAHGFISEPANSSLVSNMPDGALVQALEFGYRPAISAARAARIREKVRPSSAEPAPILSKRVIVPYEAPTSADTMADAVAINMAESGRVDIERIASLMAKNAAEIESDLAAADKPLLFRDPETDEWVSRNDYLTGHVKRKLKAARAARLTANIIALQEVQPEPWGAENVTALLGSSWVPPTVYADFVEHISGNAARVAFSAITNSYSVNGRADNRSREDEWASPGYTSVELISDLLNNNQIKVLVYDKDGKAHIHQENTALALHKAKTINAEFSDWVYKDGERRNQLVDIFNEKFNTRVNRQHDGAHLILPGKVPDAVIAMRRHQKNTIWRGISERFMLIDHAVGAGKTFTAIARAMERRRMGLSQKPAIVVPNHMVEQFTTDVYRLYPGAKVLAAGKKDFEKSRRRKLFAKIATGDFDIVIIPHSSFGFIGISPETEERYLQKELDAALLAVKDAEAEADHSGQSSFRKPFGVKEAERLVDKITARMERVQGDKTKDRLLTFEQMGIDDLTVDEAHEFKNLFYSSRLTGVKGMGNKTGSQKSFDLYNKVRVLRESPKGTVTFMTGTPISNSAVEMYNMMRFLAADELAELGLEHFDAWRAQFVSTDAGWEPTETGRLKEVNRLGRTWSNMRSLMDLYYSFTDSVDNDDIKKAYAEDNNGEQFPIPRVVGGDRQSVVIEPTKAQVALLNDVLDGFDALPAIKDPYERNKARLRLMDRARKVSLDVRAADPYSKSKENGGKLDRIADEVKRIYSKWDADRGTQLIFLDRSVPKTKGDDAVLKEYDTLVAALRRAYDEGDEAGQRLRGEQLERFDANEMEELRNAQSGGWNAYQQIKDNLIARGVPAGEIRFIQEASTDARKQAIFDAVNDGTIRVLIGSTPRMGAGTNVQKRLVAIHHADVTWKPSDIEQREGRGIRQGNELLKKYGIDRFEIEILAYATERTIDAKMWALNASKLKTINAIRKYDGAFSMDFEDEDSVSMAELAALASGDPMLLERVKLMSEIDKLELLKRVHARKEWGITGQIEDAEAAIARNPGRELAAEADLAVILAGNAVMEQDAATRSVNVQGEHFSDGSLARGAVIAAVKAQQGGDEKKKVSVKVGNRRLSSLDGALAAVGSAIGDQQTFLMHVDGKAMIARTDAARAIAELASDASAGLAAGEAQTIDIGKYLGLQLQATMESGREGFWTSLAVLRADGSTLATGDTKLRDNAEYSTSAMRTAVEDLEKALVPAGLEYAIGNYQRRYDAAVIALPELRARQGGPFAQQGELDAKNARLEVVIRELSSGGATAARNVVERTNPLQRADGSFKRQAPDKLMFSRARIDTDAPLVNIFSHIATDDDAFRLPDSNAKSLAGILGETAPGMAVEEIDAPDGDGPSAAADRVWMINGTAGQGRAFVFRDTRRKQFWLDISNWKEGQSGATVYQGVATLAHNTGHVFIGDPAGLSDKALYRRTEHMISSALRHGTTKHLAPHARQTADVSTASGADVRPLDWREGEDAHNLQEMLVSSYTNILHFFPEIADVTYNFARARFERAPVRAPAGALLADASTQGEFLDDDGLGFNSDRSAAGRPAGRADEGAGHLGRMDAVPFTDADFSAAAKSVRSAYELFFPSSRGAHSPPFGVSDLKRAVLTQSVLQEAGRDGGRDVLDQVSERLLQRVSPQLADLLYSRDAEYFRDDGVSSLPTLPAGVDAGTAGPLELSGVDFLRAMKATEQLNRELAKADMAPVRALRTAPNAQFALARQIGKALGIEVNFVSKNAEFEGVAYNGVAYLTEGMRNAELAIAGHETLHALEQSNPELGAKLRTQIRAYLKEGVVEDRQAREFAANGFQDVTEGQAEAEVIADINGGMWMDPVFWSDLAKADRALFRQVAYKFMEVAAKLIKSLRGSRFDVASLVRDIDAVRAIMVATWAENNATRDAATPAPVVSRAMRERSVALPSAEWLTDEAIAKEVENRIGKFEHQPVIRIRDSAFGVLPGIARDEHVSGAVYEGVIYLFRDALPTLREVQWTLFHEMLHYGLQRFLPSDEYITRMNMIYQRDGAFRAEADRWVKTSQGQLAVKQGGQKYATARGIDEALAVLAEPNAGVFVRTDVRAKVERTVQRWLANLAEWLGMPEAAAYWRGMKNEEARALIQQIFRKTATDFPPADPWAGTGSAARRKGKASSGAADPRIAFSRTGLGNALASAANSIAEVRLPANYRVGDLFNGTGKLSWWHKSIGTMDNLAKRQPAFAAVYGAVQRFLGDVSRYAVVAADLAPTLLPKLENVADIVGKNRKKALTAADTKAIGAPIFEGTLIWGRDAHGKAVRIEDLEKQAEAMSTADKARILLNKGIIDDQQNRAWQHNPGSVYDSIIDSRFKDTQLRAGVVWSDAELGAMFNLSNDQVVLYRQFRAALDKSLTNLTISEMVKLGGKDAKGMLEQAVAAPDLPAAAELLRDHFVELARQDPAKLDMHLDTAKQIMNLADKGKDLMERGYAPLSRFGKHTVYVQEGEDQVYFGMFETQYEASKMARDMRAEHPGAEVTHGTVSADAYKLFAGVSPETIELFGSMVGLDSQASAASTEVYQTYLKLAKNNRSSMKRMIQRKGIAGFSEDAGRVLAGFIYSNARLTAGNAHLGEIDEAVTEIPKQQGELTDAAMQLREHIRNPEAGAPLGGLMFAQFLGGSVASAMVNLTQPFTMTLPYLSQFGGLTKAGARLAAAVKDAGKDATGDARLDAAMQWAIEEGIVAPQEVHYLQAQASGKGALRAGDGTKAGNTRAHLNNAMAKVTLGWGKLFAMAELANRRITFIAAYRTAVDEGFANPAKFAQEAVAQTQGTYNSGNKPKWARGAVGSLLMTFKQYSIGYLELLSRMAFAGAPGSKERAAGRRAALYMVAVLLLMGGADGLPFEQDLEDAVDGILQRLGYNFSSKRSKQAFLTDTLGQGGADFVLKGVSSMPGMPVDVAGRFGMGNLLPGTGLLTKKDSYTRDLGELAGPAGDVAKRAFSGAGKLLGGDLAGAVLDVTPAAVRNVAKGADMLATGAYRDTRGYNVNETSGIEAVMKMIGFQPNSTADVQDAKGQALNMVGQNRMRSMEIAEHWAQGLAAGDLAKVEEARAWRDDWNVKNPGTPIRVSMPGVIKRVKAMRQDAVSRTQKTAPAALKQTVRRELAETRAE